MALHPTRVIAKPGHGHLLDWIPVREPEYRGEPYPNALAPGMYYSGTMEPITLRELAMLRFINQVTDKLDWTTKVFDEAIIARWKTEAVNLSDASTLTEMSEAMFDYCISELQFRATEHPSSPNGAIRVYNGDVYKSDTAVSEETKLALRKAVRVLEDVPAAQKDWHPGSGGKVLDLVHPSLFPLVFGTSKILPIGSPITTLEDCIKRCGEGETIPDPNAKTPSPEVHDEDAYSAKFQWLPCEVDISGERPKILTYVNNLHPQRHQELYSLLEDLIQAAIPLWNLTLVQSDDLFCTPSRIGYSKCTWIGDTRVPMQPEPENMFDPSILQRDAPTNLREKFGDRPLQVIVKLANIELTPEKPEYEGGTWHVEGKISPPLSNEESLMEVSYEQDAHEWLQAVFGLEQHGNTIQDVGSVETREGRLITFPNVLQHRVQPFKLADPTKPGHRKIVALFLVDPNLRVISTADVPCQRQDWWAEEVLKTSQSPSPSSADSSVGGVFKLPPELQKIIFEDVDGFPITMEKAKEYRERLMEERKTFVLKNNEDFASGEISLCEH